MEEARFETLVDRVNTTGAVWLGSTVGCAQCHNHKFDPFSQQRLLPARGLLRQRRVLACSARARRWWTAGSWSRSWSCRRTSRRSGGPRCARRRQAALRARTIATWTPSSRPSSARSRGRHPRWTPLDEVTSGFERRRRGPRSTEQGTCPTGPCSWPARSQDKDTYTVTVRTPLSGITGVPPRGAARSSLPQKGPGRSLSGAFVVTGFERSKAGAGRGAPGAGGGRLQREAATGSAGHRRRPASGWGVTADADVGRPLLIVQARRPRVRRLRDGDARPAATAEAGATRTLTFTLEFQPGWPHVRTSLGRFRLSATTARNPWGGLQVPDEVRATLATQRGERTEEQEGGASRLVPSPGSLPRRRARPPAARSSASSRT